jgi:predicted nucleic acid binding AN1-type Zn finger protein
MVSEQNSPQAEEKVAEKEKKKKRSKSPATKAEAGTTQKEIHIRKCNICGREFKGKNRFARFCDVCKGKSDVYRFAGNYIV